MSVNVVIARSGVQDLSKLGAQLGWLCRICRKLLPGNELMWFERTLIYAARVLNASKMGRQLQLEDSHSANTSCSVLNVAVSVFAETSPSFFANLVLSTART